MPKAKTTEQRTAASPAKKAPKVMQTENDIFALDIGTRNVVGIVGHMDDGIFCVDHSVCVPHKRRAVMDGQIEDIGETARIVRKVKEQLEDKACMTLTKVAIAAAGRALITKRAAVETSVDGKDKITETILKALELEAVSKAQDELDKESSNGNISFYCVGHTVISYKLDNYQIKSLLGHKGKKASVELIAAFLPGLVVESLYTVMDMNGLDVSSLTLEPIAAMNVIIPPEVRLINIALVDIGAGTTDIAVSQNGSIVAYAMATIAGDEITEEIIRKYLVDFETAEQMKLTPADENIVFTDILGFEHEITPEEFYSGLSAAVEQLADTIATNIINVNGEPPAAVFLVGGGSLIPDLPALVADRLKIPENRVAIGGQNISKTVNVGRAKVVGPEYVTPIGIGITATLQTGYEFSTVTLNNAKMRIFDTKSITAADLLMNAGFKTTQIIGKSGRGLTFTLNGEKQNLRGEPSSPARILINGLPASLEYTIKQGDEIEFTPAQAGANACVTVSDIAGKIERYKVYVDGTEYYFGTAARANDVIVSGEYSIQNYDTISIETIETLGDLIMSLPFDCDKLAFYKADRLCKDDCVLSENDSFVTRPKDTPRPSAFPNGRAVRPEIRDEKANRTVDMLSSMPISAEHEKPASVFTAPEPVQTRKTEASESAEPSRKDILFSDALTADDFNEVFASPTDTGAAAGGSLSFEQDSLFDEPEAPASNTGSITVYLNSRRTVLDAHRDGSPHEFLELMAIADIDISNPPPSGNMILTLNGKNASFMDLLKDGDDIVIRWDVK